MKKVVKSKVVRVEAKPKTVTKAKSTKVITPKLQTSRSVARPKKVLTATGWLRRKQAKLI